MFQNWKNFAFFKLCKIRTLSKSVKSNQQKNDLVGVLYVSFLGFKFGIVFEIWDNSQISLEPFKSQKTLMLIIELLYYPDQTSLPISWHLTISYSYLGVLNSIPVGWCCVVVVLWILTSQNRQGFPTNMSFRN